MKQGILLAAAIAMCTASVHAELTKGSQTLAIQGGAGGSSTQYDYVPGNQEPVTGGGGAIGAQYVYFITEKPTFGVGLDYLQSFNGDRTDDDLLSGYNTTQRLKSSVVLGIIKLAYPRGKLRPYVFSGVGVHHSRQTLEAQPQSGNWPGGGSESRRVIDETKTSAALGYGIGLDIFPTDVFFIGIELRGTWLAGLDTDDNAALNTAGFTEHNNNAITQGNLLLRAGIKF